MCFSNWKSMIRIFYTAFIFIVLVGYFRNGYSQTYPIPATGSQWGCVTMLGPPGLTGSGLYGNIEKYNIADTVIQDFTYQHWAGVYTRYVNNRLVRLDIKNSKPDSLVETVYYDFNLNVNDSFLISRFNKYATVTDVSYIQTLNGQTRKRILLRVKDFTCINRLEWIEGIGDIRNSVFYEWQLGMCDIYRSVVCFSDSSGEIYLENGFTHPCDSLNSYVRLFDATSIDNVKTNILKQRVAYPNPFSSEIKIDLSGLFQFKTASLFNAAGVLVVQTDHDVIQTYDLKPGIYVLKIELGNECFYRKMIKNF